MSNTEERIEKAKAKMQDVYAEHIVGIIKHVLKRKNPCEHEEHRVQPKRFDDWKAIDNHMHAISDALEHLIPRMVMRVGCLYTKIYEHEDDHDELGKLFKDGGVGDEAVMFECMVKAHVNILVFHHEILAKYGQGNNADIHYDRIINMAEEMYAEVNKRIKKLGYNRVTEFIKQEYEALMAGPRASKQKKEHLH